MPAVSDPRQPPAPGWFTTVAGQVVLASEAQAVAAGLCAHPAGSWLWLAPEAVDPIDALPGWGLRLGLRGHRFEGPLRCGLPLPLASESLGCVVLQHVCDLVGEDRVTLLEECARVLLPAGMLVVVALNPASPYRLRWQGQGLASAEPVTWRRRLRRAGLTPEAVALGIGPRWQVQPDPRAQEGAGLRAAYLVRARKRLAQPIPVQGVRIGRVATVPAA